MPHSCYHRYMEGVEGKMERNFRLADYFDGRDWDTMTADKQFIFFQVCTCTVLTRYRLLESSDL